MSQIIEKELRYNGPIIGRRRVLARQFRSAQGARNLSSRHAQGLRRQIALRRHKNLTPRTDQRLNQLCRNLQIIRATALKISK